eukprot:scaffold110065_cov41-Tisochrysis_lutea.AAC.1
MHRAKGHADALDALPSWASSWNQHAKRQHNHVDLANVYGMHLIEPLTRDGHGCDCECVVLEGSTCGPRCFTVHETTCACAHARAPSESTLYTTPTRRNTCTKASSPSILLGHLRSIPSGDV